MQFLILASDPSVVPWLEVLAARGAGVVACWSLDSTLQQQLQSRWPQWSWTDKSGLLEQSLSTPKLGVLVAGAHPELLAVARQLGNLGLPLLVVTTTSGPASALFELMPLWEERRTLLVPGFTSGLTGMVQQLPPQLVAAGIIRVDRIECQRSIVANGLLPLEQVYQWFFQDACWLTQLVRANATPDGPAEWEHVLTVWTGLQQERLAQGMVTLSGEHVPETTWTLRPAQQAGWRLTVWGNGRSLELSSDTPSIPGLVAEIEQTLSRFESRIQQPSEAAQNSWDEVLQCGHLLAAVQTSAVRQRKIAVHYEAGSERSQFKTQMATIGCGVLLWALFGSILMLLLAAALDPRDREQKVAQAAGFILTEADFVDQQSKLTVEGEEHVRRIAQSWSSTTATVILENPWKSGEVSKLLGAREATVATVLAGQHGSAAADRILIRPVTGQWFMRSVLAGWCVVFGPLGLALLAQLLIVASHPGRRAT